MDTKGKEMIIILTEKDLVRPFDVDVLLDVSSFKTPPKVFFLADFVYFKNCCGNRVLKNRTDGYTGLMTDAEIEWYIKDLMKVK